MLKTISVISFIIAGIILVAVIARGIMNINNKIQLIMVAIITAMTINGTNA